MANQENERIKRVNQEIEIKMLKPFDNHPFSEYKGNKLADMIESIKENGVLEPIIVRPFGKANIIDSYQILSGHNRKNAAEKAGLKKIPAVVYTGLTEEEAILIVTETNIVQRSFADLKYSERAFIIYTHYHAMKKKPGYRTDLVNQVEELTLTLLASRSSVDKLGLKYGLSGDTIRRYLRVYELINSLKTDLDNEKIPFLVAFELAYLRKPEQEYVHNILGKGVKLSLGLANKLHKESNKQELSEADIESFFEQKPVGTKIKAISFPGTFFSQYFDEKQSQEEIKNVVAKALEEYFSKDNK